MGAHKARYAAARVKPQHDGIYILWTGEDELFAAQHKEIRTFLLLVLAADCFCPSNGSYTAGAAMMVCAAMVLESSYHATPSQIISLPRFLKSRDDIFQYLLIEML